MFDDDAGIKKTQSVHRSLTDMSVGELDEYIVELNAEITRAKEDIVKKKASMDAANSVFK